MDSDFLFDQFPGRAEEIQQLLDLFEDTNHLPKTLYVYGGPSTGKTSIVKSLCDFKKIQHAFINLVECYTPKILFESILNQLSLQNKELETNKCDCLMDFLLQIENLNKKQQIENFIIVLDKAERLRNMDFNLQPAFLRLNELYSRQVCTIFISELPFQKFYSKTNLVEPIKIYFPQYNKDELLDILLDNFCENTSYTEDFYKNYLNAFLSVFYRACRDLSELRYMAKINFDKYCEPITKKECTAKDSIVLWRNIAPVLKSSSDVLYLRISGKSQPISKENYAQSLELPFYAKYLLIAAYLASYNPAKDDKRMFMKYHGKKTKTMKDIKNKSKTSELLNTQLGPKPFSFDRLLAIFYAILNEKVGFNNNLLVQVSSLVELQLLTSQSDSFNLDGQKYKCCVEFDFILSISKMVGFNIRKYLSDFSHY